MCEPELRITNERWEWVYGVRLEDGTRQDRAWTYSVTADIGGEEFIVNGVLPNRLAGDLKAQGRVEEACRSSLQKALDAVRRRTVGASRR